MGLALGACSDKLGELEDPAFDVKVEKTTFKVNEPVVFTITGVQDNISLYSGEGFNDYAFKDGRKVVVTGKGATLDFSTQLAGTGTQTGQVSIWLSDNYNGQDDFASVKAATWTEITSGFTLAATTTNVASGKLDISTWIDADKPVYLGFKYITKPQAVNGLARVWWIQNMMVRSKAPFVGTQELLIANQENIGFRTINQYPEAPALNTITASRATLLGNKYKDPNDSIFNPNYSIYDTLNPIYDPRSPVYQPSARIPVFVPYDPASPYNDPLTETWVISKALQGDTVSLGPDKAISVKGINTDAVEEYRYTYKTPGNYKVYFIAYNHNKEETKTVVRQLDLTITP
jgi:hypothetical protein